MSRKALAVLKDLPRLILVYINFKIITWEVSRNFLDIALQA